MKLLVFCYAFRGRRTKFFELQKAIFGAENIVVASFLPFPEPNIKSILWKKPEDILPIIDKVKPDIVHAHIDNSLPAILCMEKKIPIVMDLHDHACIPLGTKDVHMGDVLSSDVPKIFVSDAFFQYIKNHYGNIKNYKIIPPFPPRSWLNFTPLTKICKNSIVWEGGLYDSHYVRRGDEVFKRFLESGIDIHVYHVYSAAPSIAARIGYKNRNDRRGSLNIHKRIEISKLYQELSQYHVGLTFVNKSCSKEWQQYASTALENKVFDYMASGLPVIGYNVGFVQKYIKRFGICVDEINDLPGAFYKAKYMKINFDELKEEFVLDNYYNDLKEMYNQVSQP